MGGEGKVVSRKAWSMRHGVKGKATPRDMVEDNPALDGKQWLREGNSQPGG
jgi:hypothetical protein